MVQVCEEFFNQKKRKKEKIFFPTLFLFPSFFKQEVVGKKFFFAHLFFAHLFFFFYFNFCSKRILKGDAVYCDQAHSDDFCDCPENCEQPQPGTIVVNSNDMKKFVFLFLFFSFFL